ncbi:MAG TPA: autotransporter-associated beta strand repeat-containing protein [Chthoniobacteraceae bacterium]|nr:autotransporter-associated beta strand repeat-containing protein [Chthoniobacteraceae bacterium]
MATANTHAATSLESGVLEIGHNASLGAGALNVTGNAIMRPTTTGLAPANNIVLGNNVTLTIDTGANGFSVPGVISDTNGSVTKTGSGTLTLAGANSYVGPTTVLGGELSVSDLQDGGFASNVGQSPNAAANLVLDNAVNVPGGLRLSDGVVLNNNITATVGSNEFVDVPDPGASAVLGGSLAVAGGGNQLRIGVSGPGATLTVAGTSNIGSATSFVLLTRGNLIFSGTGALDINTANDTLVLDALPALPSISRSRMIPASHPAQATSAVDKPAARSRSRFRTMPPSRSGRARTLTCTTSTPTSPAR